MTIVLYCQYVWGMGHLFRSVELARALSGHHVVLVAGGQEVALELPGHVELARLPALFMDERFTSLISGVAGRSVEAVQRQRRQALAAIFERARPEIFIVELYPLRPHRVRLRAGAAAGRDPRPGAHRVQPPRRARGEARSAGV